MSTEKSKTKFLLSTLHSLSYWPPHWKQQSYKSLLVFVKVLWLYTWRWEMEGGRSCSPTVWTRETCGAKAASTSEAPWRSGRSDQAPGLHTNPDLGFEILPFTFSHPSPFEVALVSLCVPLVHSWSSKWWEPVGQTLMLPLTTFTFPATRVQSKVRGRACQRAPLTWLFPQLIFLCLRLLVC